MSSSSCNYCKATFKNKKLNKFLNSLVVTETSTEEWLVLSEDTSWYALGFPEDGMNGEPHYFIGKPLAKPENLKPNNRYVETYTTSYFDVAKLLGIRNVCFGQKGDKRLNKKELKTISEFFKRGGVLMFLDKGKTTKTQEKLIRLINACSWCDEKGKTTISFNTIGSSAALPFIIALSSKFPKTRIELEDYEDEWDSREGYFMSQVITVIKNGKDKIIVNKSESEHYYDD